MSQVKQAVLELTSAIHNWRHNPSTERLQGVVIAADALGGFALHLEQSLEQAVTTDPERCVCGGALLPVHLAGVGVPTTKCTTCATIFALVRLNGGPSA